MINVVSVTEIYLRKYHWGLQRDLTPPFVDDGHLEVVGFRDGWHGLVLLAPNGHGTRLAQVRIELLLSLVLILMNLLGQTCTNSFSLFLIDNMHEQITCMGTNISLDKLLWYVKW